MEDDAYRSLASREFKHWFCVVRREVVAASVRREGVRPGGRVLEIGSGTGGNVQMLREFGDLTCIEPSRIGRDLTVERYGAELDLRAAQWPGAGAVGDGEEFDLIAMLDVLEHLDEPVAALEAARERLAPGGRIVATVPNYRWLWSAHDRFNHHKDRYTPARLRDQLHRAGLKPVRVTSFNTLLFPLAVAARVAVNVTAADKSLGSGTPRPVINETLTRIFRLEVGPVSRGLNFPWGLSTLAIAEPL